jgi:site-specific recombinase XerD
VTQLRQKMLEELRRRNYSRRTARTYVRIVRDFAEYFHQPPDKLGPEQIRQYQAHLFQVKKLAPATVSQYSSALRFLFVKTLRRHFLAEYIPFPKSGKRLPTVLSPEEVTRLIDLVSPGQGSQDAAGRSIRQTNSTSVWRSPREDRSLGDGCWCTIADEAPQCISARLSNRPPKYSPTENDA